jgi:hypothetical protein
MIRLAGYPLFLLERLNSDISSRFSSQIFPTFIQRKESFIYSFPTNSQDLANHFLPTTIFISLILIFWFTTVRLPL